VFLLTGGTCEIEIEVEVEADTGTIYCGCFIVLADRKYQRSAVNLMELGHATFSIAVASMDNDTLRPLDRCAGCL